MQQRGLHAVRPEVEQEARHRRPQAPQRAALAEQGVRAQDVGVGDHDVRRHALAALQPDGAHTGAGALDRLHARAAAHVQRARHRLDQRVDAAVGVPAAVEHLQIGERGIDRRHAERIAADEQRVERERLAHPRMPEMARDEPVQGHDRPQPRHPRQHRRERPHVAERAPARAEDALLIDRPQRVQERGQPRRVAFIEAGDLLAQPFDVRAEVERAARPPPSGSGRAAPAGAGAPRRAGRARPPRTSPRAPTAS